eukprot:TRINITY_DN7282_c0_g2_i4.p1 TRINITY_DN7282_c0_g2~~TRINITY_DN7282_c0_g2_i4.p1  ORF type:complete len:143 (-),score=9.39 TRINITY_DN7282_c0_g2_i4:187-615(-)
METRCRFFKDGGTFLEDLSFSCYYHNTAINIFLHLCTFYPAMFGLLHLLRYNGEHWSTICAFALASPYLTFFFFDLLVGTVYGFIAVTMFSISLYLETSETGFYLALFCLFGLPLQFMGHLVFEKRFPAFRAFEGKSVISPF